VTDSSTEPWDERPYGQFVTIARNLGTRYLAIAAETVVGLLLLPFNLAHLGKEAYGLWVLLGAVTIHFSTLELGYGSGLVKFVAHYRAHRDARAMNEVVSTLFWVFLALAFVTYGIIAALSFNLEHVFAITPEQAQTGQWILLIIGVYVAMNFPFSVYGGIICGFQRYDVNNTAGVVITVAAAAANVVVLSAGYGLVTLVATTTFIRLLGYYVYRQNAFRVFPPLRIRPSLFRMARLREVTGFSIYASIIDWANKLNYQIDQVIIGIFLGSAAVAVWAPAERIISGVQRLTNQLNGVIFPTIVDNTAAQQQEQLQEILREGTRLSLVMVVPISAALIVLADPLVHAWLGAQAGSVAGCIPVIQILAVAVGIRVGTATGTTILKGAGDHRLLAWVNLATGIVNAVISILVINRFGLVGLAWGTLLPLAVSSIFILFPAACRRVGLPLRRAYTEAVLPAMWPAFVAAGVMALTRQISSGTLLAVAFEATVGGVIYLALFFAVAIDREDRAYYLARATQLTRKGGLAPAGSM
jgi:O-antigen/teichoic acid export membrane protein